MGEWSGGGLLTGMFFGEDNKNVDGLIDFMDGEVTGFMAEWSGNGFVPPLSWGFVDLNNLIYDLDIDGEGHLFFLSATMQEDDHLEVMGGANPTTFHYGLIHITSEQLTESNRVTMFMVTPKPTIGVPEGGSTLTMLGMVVAGLALRRRRP